MRKLLAACCFLLLGSLPAFSQVLNPVTPLDNGSPVGASNPLHVTGSFSASLGGFTPSASGARGTPVSVTTADSNGTLPTGTVVVVSNVGSNPMYCNVNGIAATTSDQLVTSGGGWFAFTKPSGATVLHCIATGGSTTANMVGGDGLPTGTGGGSGGGGGGAITAASGSYAAGAFSAGAGVDGWDLTQGTKADAPCTLPATTTACSLLATAKAIANAANASVPAGTNLIGNVGQLYPAGSTPITASATGTTAATTATLAANATKSTYICGFSIRANATAATTNNATVTGPVTGTLNFTQWTAPTASGLGVTEEVFSPCIISSAVNTAIAVISGAPGTGGVVSVTAWGFQL